MINIVLNDWYKWWALLHLPLWMSYHCFYHYEDKNKNMLEGFQFTYVPVLNSGNASKPPQTASVPVVPALILVQDVIEEVQ